MAKKTKLPRPTKAQEERLLHWINRQRDGRISHKGWYPPLRRLPKGIPDDSCECVLGRALGHRAETCIDPPGWRATPYLEFTNFPKFVAAFMERFDSGEYPALIDQPPESEEGSR